MRNQITGFGMKRILFVDDDLRFLEALRVGLLPRADEWTMTFVESGARAIEELERSPRDVIVADVRMPGMDGAQLLRAVRERWPDTVRIVLSGAADLADVVRLLPVAHQYLNKPCQARQLEEVIERSLDVQAILSKSVLRALLGSTDRVPAQPRVFSRLQVAMANEKISAREVSRIIRADAMVTAKVLQIVNSAFFRPARRVTSIEQAVTYLGFPAVRNLALCAEVFAHRPRDGSAVPLNLERLQQHATQVAAVVHALTTETFWNDDAVLAALLHDIGYWVLVQERPRDLEKALEVAIADRIPMHEAETRVLGASHAEVGAYLLGLWGLPYPIVEAVARHHTPADVRIAKFDVLASLALAMALSGTDDSDVFLKTPPRSAGVQESYLANLSAPYTWSEAEERAVECLRRIEHENR
ncbi:MAG TPA: response regulator [Steroidobacteraceae bacterium]|nr:response regulator [Steroidobacteraceae bacterium]